MGRTPYLTEQRITYSTQGAEGITRGPWDSDWRIYMLNCMAVSEGGARFAQTQLAWLKADLAKALATHHILAMVHYPMFASVCEYHLKDMTSKGRVGPMWEALQGSRMRVCGELADVNCYLSD